MAASGYLGIRWASDLGLLVPILTDYTPSSCIQIPEIILPHQNCSKVYLSTPHTLMKRFTHTPLPHSHQRVLPHAAGRALG